MKTVEVKVSELEGAALDWAVAVADGVQPILWDVCCGNGVTNCNPSEPPECCCNPEVQVAIGFGRWQPSTDWSQGGPLIEKYRPDVQTNSDGQIAAYLNNSLSDPDPLAIGRGDTYMIAVCRAIVAAKLGDTVQIPAELA